MDASAANDDATAVQHDWAAALALREPVASGGYRWWYIDGVSDDGLHGLTLIAFVGSVFSPYYAWARRRGAADPRNHVAMNVGLYGALGHRWAMTERGSGRLAVAPEELVIGPSALRCDGRRLQVSLDEVTAPLPSRIQGTVTVTPAALHTRRFALDEGERHYWQPVAPIARIDVQLQSPALSWRGHGYVDSNGGDEPIGNAFNCWDWSRAALADGSAAMFYDITRRDGSTHLLSLRAGDSGKLEEFAAPPRVQLPHSGWRVARSTRSETAGGAKVQATLEDGPFYARSLVRSTIDGHSVLSVHESVSLERFRAPWVRALLPFKMPRRG